MKNRYIRIIIAMLVLHFCGAAGLWADDLTGKILIKLMPSGANNGTGSATSVSATEGSVSVSISGRVVTLTVTPSSEPGSGYKIKKDLIEVEKMVDPSRSSSRRRTPGLGFFELTSSSASADGWVPNSSETSATYTFTVPEDYDGAYVTATFVSAAANAITSLSDIDDMDGNYVLAQDIDASGSSSISGDFTGTLDGDFHKIYNLENPIFGKIDGGTVKNIMLEGVDISSGNTDGDAGAICCVATGSARIYNCGILPTTTNHDKDGNVTDFEGSSVGASGNVGGIVGLLDGNARVINCFSYATITGGTMMAGIVGKVTSTVAINQDNVATAPMVVNCMFYGEITGVGTIFPVYGGQMIKTDAVNGVNPYCYFRGNAAFNTTTNFANIDAYNRSWPADEEYLTRFEYYRSILNSNRKLCTWWVSGTVGTVPTDADVKTVGIAKWVLDPEMAPYPILKKWDKYPSIINPDPDRTWDPEANGGAGAWQDRSMAEPYRGKKLSTSLSVTINAGAHNSSALPVKKNIPITDMDTLNHDYGYYKIQLPYYNEVFGNPNGATHAEKYGNNYTDQVVTGWKITAVTGGTQGTFDGSSNKAWESGYNFADRNCTDKDKYDVSGRVFAQGGYYYVPEGVTAITIEAYWGKAVYLHNRAHNIDRVNITSSSGNRTTGSPFAPAGTLPTTYFGQTVYDAWHTAVTKLDAATLTSDGKLSKTVYDQAIVLLSNFQLRNENGDMSYSIDNKWHPHTLMSVDEDFDNEPDYCFEFQFRKDFERPAIQPIRFDFLPVPELGLAVRHGKDQNTIGIFIPQGHFEITETSFMHTTQFEYDFDKTKNEAPVILNGGHFEQIVVRRGNNSRTSYFLMGGHFRMRRFTPGRHCNKDNNDLITRHCAVNAIGGEYPEFYLSGIYNVNAGVNKDNPHCYINGGKFDMIAGAGYEAIDGDITFKIDHAIINEFYGGGINGANPVTGSIDVTINNSLVNKYCGGPKVGEMGTGKTVTTHASGTIFGRYYGGGNGGTSYYRQQKQDGNVSLPNPDANGWKNNGYSIFNPLNTISGTNPEYEGPGSSSGNLGYHALFEFECFVESNGIGGLPTVRSYLHWAQFGTTSTGNTTNVLDNCTVKQDFYGGGNLGNVNGDVNSTLTDCKIEGNAFAGGFSGTIEPFRIHDKSKTTFPKIDNAGIMQYGNGEFEYVKNDDGSDRYYTWCYKNAAGKMFPEGVVIPDNVRTKETGKPSTFEYPKGSNKWYVLTSVSLEGLGAVSGKATINIEGETQVKGSVFGGGNESAVDGGTEVNVDANVGEIAYNCDNVYGGGNTADVVGDTEVNVLKGTVKTDVFGGGKGSTTVVDGSVTVNIGKDEGGTLSGDGTVLGDVYGGSALGAVNAASVKDADGNITSYTPSEGKTTTVNIYAGTVTGRVFGGGLGHDDADAAKDIAAQNFGTTTVNMEGGTTAAVYGGANENGVLKQDATVNITGGTIGTARVQTSDPVLDVVFGGGLGQPTLVEGNVTVNVGSYYAIGDSPTPTSTPTIYGNAYGGSALGNVNASKTGSAPISYDETKEVKVNLYSGTIYGNVFGGCLGRKAVAESGTEGQEGYVAPVAAIEAFVGGDVTVILDGAKLDCVFSGTGDDRVPLTGQIFGCNNWNGTPLGHVLVHVKRTVDSAKPDDKDRDERTTYDVAAVYGGGNQADYVPRNALLDATVEANKAKFEAARAEVIIEGCDLTSIEYVYGGGNAASVPATEVIVRGTYIIDYLFGGGNGKSTSTFTNPGADIGLRAKTTDGTAYENDPTKEAYGTGRAVSKLIAGKIHVVFGGSNTKGNVRQGTSVTMPQESGSSPAYCSEIDIREIYGAGQNADQDGGVTMILGCVDNMDYVYGGARDAHVKGGVDLVITSGHYKGVFGGNDTSGSIQGPIKLTIEETGCDPLVIDNLYLGGNKAAYSIYGYKDVSGTLVARTKTEYDELTTEQKKAEGLPYADPVLNVVSCTSIGNMFGGGLGSGAIMYGSPTVNINMIKGNQAGKDKIIYLPKEYENIPNISDVVTIDANTISCKIKDEIGSIGNVYGGGQEANVVGSTTVNICTEEKVTERSSMGASITGTSKDVIGANIIENVFGAGKGKNSDVNSAMVTGNTTITMVNGSVTKSVYGGGELSQVGGNTTIIISGGTIGKNREGDSEPYTYYGDAEYGNVFGGGLGNGAADADVKFGLVTGNTNITIQERVADAAWVEAHPDAGKTVGDVLSSPTIYHNIYGGGAMGSVGDFTYDGTTGLPSGLAKANTGKATITITGGTIGTDGHNNGMVFGSSRGVIDAPNAIHDKLAWVYDTEVVIGTPDAATGPTLYGSLYGGGENGHVYNDATVTMNVGTVGDPSEYYAYRGNVYGAGCGTDMYYSSSIPDGHTAHDGEGDKYNPIAGIVKGNATVTINGGDVANNVYGAGSMGKVEGSTSVIINTEGAIGVDGNHDDGNVYGAARGEVDLAGKIPTEDNANNYSSITNSSVTLTKGTVKGSLYGGGKAGVVNGAVTVNLNGGTILHDAYGGGALAKTNTEDSYDVVPSSSITVDTTPVDGYFTRSGAGTNESPYVYTPASGKAVSETTYYRMLNTTTITLAGADVTGNLYGGGLGQVEAVGPPAVTAVAADVNGPITVTVSSGTANNVFGCNNVNGSPKKAVTVNVSGGTITNSVYGGGNQAAYTYAHAAAPQNLKVNISGGKMDNVYGGGLSADVAGGIDVTITGGTVTNDVYGGGALANTNTANWDAVNDNWNVAASDSKYYYYPVKHLKPTESSVTGYYTDPSDPSSLITDETAKAVANVTYYKRLEYEENIHSLLVNGTTYKTTVTLTGGTIGNAYGGGLGKLTTEGLDTGDGAVKAMVYGDVSVVVNGSKFTQEVEPLAGNAPKTGRVFGCNNVNGTPKGNVTVDVYSTTRLDGGSHTLGEFEVQGVYGGGNLANYEPKEYDHITEFGQSTKVVIHGCEATSISKVYGGGNAATVPFTDVTVNGAFEIGYVFGGGNGGDMVYKNGTWIENPGANVTHFANVLLKGGTIGQAFGASDSKGTVGGADVKQETGGECPLHLVNLYGAGNGEQASSEGDITLSVSGCGEYSEIQNVYGGSYKANIKGSVTLNITSGIFTSVYGGNDRRGSIGGNITVNIEETDDCEKPIIIQNLFGGCYQTPYPGANAETWNHDNPATYTSFTTGKITVNVRSATRIDRIFGGSDEEQVNGDTEVNINMVRGAMSGKTAVLPSYYLTNPETVPENITVTETNGYVQVYGVKKNESVNGYFTRTGEGTVEHPYVYTQCAANAVADGVTTYYKPAVRGTIAPKIGTIGVVYGGGNIGKVNGNTVVNIGTETITTMASITDDEGTPLVKENEFTVLGANIIGDVFGGCNNADVTKNSTVNYVTENYSVVDFSGTTGFEDFSVGGTIYGGGNKGDVEGNTFVTMSGGYVFNGIFGGGYAGSVGTYTDWDKELITDKGTDRQFDHSSHECSGKPKECKSGTGKCTVVVNGGQIGPVEVATHGMEKITNGHGDPVAEGWVWGGSRGLIEDPADDPDTHFKSYVNETDVTIGGTAFILESIIGGGEFGRVLGNTLVKIEGGQIGVGYKQTETVNGVLKPKRYEDSQFIDPTTNTITAGEGGNALNACSHYPYGRDTNGDGKPDEFLPFDPYYDDEDFETYINNHPEFGPASTDHPSDGKTWIGCVFGGGSGYMPYKIIDKKTDKAVGYDWCRSAGWVEGNTTVEISGGHILTNVYGANEYTDVSGTSTVRMTGGTIGVPRTLDSIAAQPLICYLFGAGKGDERTRFNQMTNTGNVVVEVTGGIIYGSVFGGSEDGHVLGDVSVTIRKGDPFTIGSKTYNDGPIIGTWGTSYVDGNVFGGGRGFSGKSLVAGVVSGNVNVNIQGGTMLGSIYGGGRLAAVGTYLVPPSYATYGTLIPDGKEQVLGDDDIDKAVNHGRININITGGTIGGGKPAGITTNATGKKISDINYSGNVYGGCMGRLTLLNDAINDNWPMLALAATATVNISGGTIHRNVYGGGEFGTLRDGATVDISGGTVNRDVYGGGLGSDDNTHVAILKLEIPGYSTAYRYTPMQWAGCVGGDTQVNISGGWIKKNVYGGGELASVGVIDFTATDEDNDGEYEYTNIKRHDNIEGSGTTTEKIYDFGLSWPYHLPYYPGYNSTSHVTVTGGRIGITGKDDMGSGVREDNGDIYGGGKGIVAPRYDEAFCANVYNTVVTINYDKQATKEATPTNYKDNTALGCIAGSVYGGGENGHVMNNASVTLTNGLIGHAIYGGGKGKDTFRGNLKRATTGAEYETDIFSVTAGKVYGNTSVSMTGGYVVRNIYGGGNMASVGKGNYAGGSDDYSTKGYGELPPQANQALWSNSDFMGSGKTTVSVTGGQVGTVNGTKDDLPTGNVFGGCRGVASPNITNSPRYLYSPEFYSGYVNETDVTIGTENQATDEVTAGSLGNAPRIYGSVYGGGQDGHVRRDAKVTFYSGVVGNAYTNATAAASLVGTSDQTNLQWLHRGNVYGSGSGIGKYEYDFNGNGKTFTDADSDEEYDEGEDIDTGEYGGATVKDIDYSNASGSVSRFTTVDILGGIIHRNVYGGGSLAPVGAPKIPPISTDPIRRDDTSAETAGKQSLNKVSISSGTIGETNYGGDVFGACRGQAGLDKDKFATSVWTEVNILPYKTGENTYDYSKNPIIYNNVYGGGELGNVRQSTHVNLDGGEIKHDAYGGGRGTSAVAANVGGNTTVELNKIAGQKAEESIYVKGCIVENVFGCNNLNGSPKGHVLVHVYATQHKTKANVSQKIAPPDFNAIKGSSEEHKDYLSRLITEGTQTGGLAVDAKVITDAQTLLTSLSEKTEAELTDANKTDIINAAKNIINALRDMFNYDVQHVYGGGNLAEYIPSNLATTGETEDAEVIIDGCQITSIKEVYGGGNAAPVPATDVKVRSCFIIHELFGGGNGFDPYHIDDVWYDNPGANVGYHHFRHYVKSTDGGYDADTHGTGAEGTPYKAILNADAKTKEDREVPKYRFGTGKANTVITGGHIHYVYGGSNILGNISTQAVSQYENSGVCPLRTEESYGGSKSAEMDGEMIVIMDCVESGGTFYGGSMDADINNNVTINITNGTYDKIFGGNNLAGTISGAITINIEEKGCTPIIINELYAGGNVAPYSVYGYKRKADGTFETITETYKETPESSPVTIQSRIPLKKGDDGARDKPFRDPYINIISASKIGTIYGGGYRAKMVGNPHVNVNMTEGMILAKYMDDPVTAETTFLGPHNDGDGNLLWYGKELGEEITLPGNVKRRRGVLRIGTIGNIYGGGNEADIIGNTYVDIGTGSWYNNYLDDTEDVDRNAAFINGNVYGGGDDADVTGNTFVTMGNGYVHDRIFGGGNWGSVGTVKTTAAHSGDKAHEGCIGKPTAFETGTGKCTVTVSGGRVGPFTYSAGVVTPDAMEMPNDYGYVFGASRGDMVDPATDPDIDFKAYVNETEVTIKNIYEDGHEGEAEHILSSPLICGGVYGGSENGRVLNDTYVYIKGGQIGEGKGKSGAYSESQWEAAKTAVQSYNPTAIAAAAAAMPECHHWDYGKDTDDDGKIDEYYPYDSHANGSTPDARPEGSDGHTFYGNVFGGGSGYWPYEKAGASGTYEWLQSAGLVEGNTNVIISGGHILTNVYGGTETTDVSGTCNVTMTGGSIGVPRTLSDIDKHPVTCYLFGAGKGDQRTYFNKRTDVSHTAVNVSGGIIYGSVFGGGEDGHVLGDADVNISGDAWIGTWGTSYVDGNVFGGGRGFSGNALTAGVVCGCVNMNISGGTMLGSIYGGGRLGSIGTYLASPTIPNPDEEDTEHPIIDNPHYGQLIPDGSDEVVENIHTASPMVDRNHGHITINITGGTIGNRYEFIDPEKTGSDWTDAKAYAPKTLYDEDDHRLLHTKGGNVFAGCMGRRTDLLGARIGNWQKLGQAKSTKLTISGDAWIMGDVFGGGEFGAVLGNHVTKDTKNEDIPVGTEILINGGTIGTEVTDEAPVKTTIPTPSYGDEDEEASNVRYTFGSVFGGGYGTDIEHDEITQNSQVDKFGALVSGNTTIKMTAGHVRASVYGGGEMAAVGGNTNIDISGGEIGRNEVYGFSSGNPGYVRFGSSTMGNVFGGGMGESIHTLLGVVKGNTTININPSATVAGEPKIYHNVYGGGALGSVGTFIFSDGVTGDVMKYIPKGIPYHWIAGGKATVNIKGGTIGISGRDNGMVNGSSRGNVAKPVLTLMGKDKNGNDNYIPKDPYDKMAWVAQSIVTIGADDTPGPHIKGSVYGGGENGHVFTHATVNVKSGTIGIVNEADPWFDYGDEAINEKAWITRGNVYGAGCGTDTYKGDDGKEHYNTWAGCVIGNTDVNISGGRVAQCVYGGGSVGSVGRILEGKDEHGKDNIVIHKDEDKNKEFSLSWPVEFTYQELTVTDPVENDNTSGKTTVKITGGRIGTTGSDNGDVFGGSRGEAGDRYEDAQLANVRETEVTIDYGSTPTDADGLAIMEYEEKGETKYSLRVKEGVDAICGSVYGGAENGHVNEDTKVTLTNGLIGHAVYGGGKGKGEYTRLKPKENPSDPDEYESVYSLTAGKVYRNTYVNMTGGHVVRNVYGGGNLGSIGKGNYAGGSDDYYPNGYGETLNDNDGENDKKLWDENANANSKAFMSSGITNVNVKGGTVGFMLDNSTAVIKSDGTETSFGSFDGDKAKLIKVCAKDDLPTGNIFGGCRGQVAAEIMNPADLTPEKNTNFFLGYVNQTAVTIGEDGSTGPRIYGSVYGGGQDGHVRRGTNVTVNKGEIGLKYTPENVNLLGDLTDSKGKDNLHWLHRGNVYGAGSGIGTYEVGTESYNSSSAGSVTHYTEVTIGKGIDGSENNVIYRNVYGGGSLASVSPPILSEIFDPDDPDVPIGKKLYNKVTVAGTVGVLNGYVEKYGGEVYGASRGEAGLNPEWFANCVWTKVFIKNGAHIMNNVFGGGDAGTVKKNTDVFIGNRKVTP